jgi:hypothetical protein
MWEWLCGSDSVCVSDSGSACTLDGGSGKFVAYTGWYPKYSGLVPPSIYLVVARSTGPSRPKCEFRVLLRGFAGTAWKRAKTSPRTLARTNLAASPWQRPVSHFHPHPASSFWPNTKWLSSRTHRTPLIWHPVTSSNFQKWNLRCKDDSLIPLRRTKSHRRDCLTHWQNRTSRKRSKNGGEGGTGVYMREGTTSRVMAADRPLWWVLRFLQRQSGIFWIHPRIAVPCTQLRYAAWHPG